MVKRDTKPSDIPVRAGGSTRGPARRAPGAAEKPAGGATADRRSAAKQAKILEAATGVFLEAGFAAASMDAIARRAGVSKRTVYNHFGSKEALFASIIRNRCDRLLHALSAPEPGSARVEAVLRALARQFLEVILAPTSLALHRLIISEAPRLQHLGALAYRAGPAVAVDSLAGYLAAQSEAGALDVADPALAAEQFFGMVLGHRQLRALLGVAAPLSETRREAAIDLAVETFLATYGSGSRRGRGPARARRGG